MKPFAESCEQNRQPILEILQREFAATRQVLEIGSGTGQHAVFFARHLPHLQWHTSDVIENHAGIRAWLTDAALDNVLPPLELDVSHSDWPAAEYDGVFSANTTHIMSWPEVEAMFAGIGRIISPGGCFCLYGPFNFDGRYTAPSNARFDVWLKQRDPLSGIRDMEALDRLAEAAGMHMSTIHSMPADNNILVWQAGDQG